MISAAAKAMLKSRELVTVTPKCSHLRVFPLYRKYLCFMCLDCKKEVSIRDAQSLELLSGVFIQAAQMLAEGVVMGQEKSIGRTNR